MRKRGKCSQESKRLSHKHLVFLEEKNNSKIREQVLIKIIMNSLDYGLSHHVTGTATDGGTVQRVVIDVGKAEGKFGDWFWLCFGLQFQLENRKLWTLRPC